MKNKDERQGPPLAPAMVEDDATEKLKKRARDLGLIVNAGKPDRPADEKKGGKK